MESKKPWQSKTIWINLILALAAMLAPQVQVYIAAHPEMVAIVFSVVNMILRVVTQGKIQISDDNSVSDSSLPKV